jgi:hypothetical protein
MAEKMDVITAGPGHVLAAGTRAGAGPSPSVAALVGSGLMLRSGDAGTARLSIAPDHLSIATFDRREGVLMMPRLFVLDNGLIEEGRSSAPTPATFNGSTVTVSLPVAATKDLVVWVYLAGAAQPIVQEVLVPKGQISGVEPLQLASGDYIALVLAEGVRAQIVTTTIP